MFENTALWKCSLAEQADDAFEKPRERLRSQLISMRSRVEQLVSRIPADCKDLTIHDVKHLDALWEAADQLTDGKWQLNPAEAFVFGAAVLTHDAGLTTLAYPEGKAGLKKTTLWADMAAPHAKTLSDGVGESSGPARDLEDSLIFDLLRELHADCAAELCTQSWNLPKSEKLYLIEDGELREAFGELIGQIASSHHWNSERITTELPKAFGGSPSLPPNWTIDARKIACLLRCSDAAQVDRTRAPLMLYAALGPKGYSDLHWRSQSKLNRPILRGSALCFTSSSSFSVEDAEAWWVAFDLAAVLDKELQSSNAILTDIDQPTFAAQRVAGADSPSSFSKFVRTSKWRPIDASIRVTDPLSLAKTLGGKNLYGPSALAPFRELIQNAADAIRARRALEGRGQEFGVISVTVEAHASDEELCWVHVDDNGIGMSERVISTALVDFGRSF